MIYLPFILLSLLSYSRFLIWNETRVGNIIVDDRVLDVLPKRDMSNNIVLLELSAGAVLLQELLEWHGTVGVELFLLQYCLVNFFKTLSLLILPLQPPTDAMDLADGITDRLIGKRLKKDLFFSGHTAFMALCLFNTEQSTMLQAAGLLTMAVMLLMTHAHFTIDVYVAPFVAYCSYALVTSHQDALRGADAEVTFYLRQTWRRILSSG